MKYLRIQDFPKRFGCIITNVILRIRKEKISCKTLIADLIRVACLRENIH